jgi:redox-regulated HSP33 family molecular chaperone
MNKSIPTIMNKFMDFSRQFPSKTLKNTRVQGGYAAARAILVHSLPGLTETCNMTNFPSRVHSTSLFLNFSASPQASMQSRALLSPFKIFHQVHSSPFI